jgi:cytoskeletal protein CcmA (bactofilin family)
MFKRGEESEWSRFSKAFTSKEKERDEFSEVGPDDDPNTRGASLAPEDPTAAPAVSPASRLPTSDTNLTVARVGGTSVAATQTHAEDVESIIGEHTFFDGTYRSESSIRIRGTAQGDIECARSVFIEENAKVSAKVKAASILVAGEVSGELTCSGRVEIRPSGRVTGTITATALVMQEGAFFDGNLRMKQEAEAPVSN